MERDGGEEGKISQRSFVFLIGSNAQRRVEFLSWLWGWTRSKLQPEELELCSVGLQGETVLCPSPGRGPWGGRLGRQAGRQQHVVRGGFCFSGISEILNSNSATEIDIF